MNGSVSVVSPPANVGEPEDALDCDAGTVVRLRFPLATNQWLDSPRLPGVNR